MTFASKVITTGVLLKAVLMGTLVSVLAFTSFEKSVILVLVSATATGVFGILIVLIQLHSERTLHERMDRLENKTEETVTQAKEEVKAQVIETATSTETERRDSP